MTKIAIIKTGGTFPELAGRKGDFEDWILNGMKVPREDALVVDAASNESLPAHNQVPGIVITGSHAMVTEQHCWSVRVADWLRGAVDQDIPILGICYGHQLLAHALGGQVGNNPSGKEFGSVELRLTEAARDDLLFQDAPLFFDAHVCHTQLALSLPPEARVLASSVREPYQAVAFRKHAWGVQFHPEFDYDAITHYITVYADALRQQGDDPEQLARQCRETSFSASLLRKFSDIVYTAHVSHRE